MVPPRDGYSVMRYTAKPASLVSPGGDVLGGRLAHGAPDVFERRVVVRLRGGEQPGGGLLERVGSAACYCRNGVPSNCRHRVTLR